MLKEEFEKLVMINDNDVIGSSMYDSVEHFYMSDNEYHKYNGGVDETKQEFVARVFGGKINTPQTVCEKLIKESQKENRFMLRYNESATEEKLVYMDRLIREHYETMLKYKM